MNSVVLDIPPIATSGTALKSVVVGDGCGRGEAFGRGFGPAGVILILSTEPVETN